MFWQFGIGEPDFWFNKTSRGPAHDNLVPVMQYRPEVPSSEATAPLEKIMNSQRPSLPALGKLLLEIWLGSVVPWDNLQARMDECRKKIGGEHWALAVETCLWGAEDAGLREPGHLLDIPEMRAEFNSADVPRQNNGTLRDETNVPSMEDNVAENWGCLHDDNDEWQPVDKKIEAATRVWQGELQGRTYALIDKIAIPQDPVRVAIIDTGVSFGAKAARLYSRRIKDCRSWVETTEQTHACGEPQSYKDCDLDGHGTHTASVLLATDKHCEVYIAKAFRARKEKRDKCAVGTHLAVANAVRYAVKVWKVDVISMSSGFDEVVDEIEDAFKVVAQHKGDMLAAASNSGNNHGTAWPARNRGVVCIYAADGYGNPYPRNPTPLLNDPGFSFLGTEVSGHWCHERTAHRSGTSVATAVAAGIHPDCAISPAQDDRRLEQLTAGPGAIKEIFHLMSDRELREGHHAIKPWELLDATAENSAFWTVAEILRAIDRAR
ncbi:hypothetical protein MBLNU13_g05584t3 [Cladosporium sp. NU13]